MEFGLKNIVAVLNSGNSLRCYYPHHLSFSETLGQDDYFSMRVLGSAWWPLRFCCLWDTNPEINSLTSSFLHLNHSFPLAAIVLLLLLFFILSLLAVLRIILHFSFFPGSLTFCHRLCGLCALISPPTYNSSFAVNSGFSLKALLFCCELHKVQ